MNSTSFDVNDKDKNVRGEAAHEKSSRASSIGEDSMLAIFTQPYSTEDDVERYWVACNRFTYTACLVPLRNPKVTPRPHLLIGFATAEEASCAEGILTSAEPQELTEQLAIWHKREDVRFIFPSNPEPPGPTVTFAETT